MVDEVLAETRQRLIRDLAKFLVAGETERYQTGKKIESYCVDALEELEGNYEQTPEFGRFIDILYGCQQLDEFGEAWAPTEKKIRGWIAFLKKFQAK